MWSALHSGQGYPEWLPLEGKLSAKQTDEVSPQGLVRLFQQRIAAIGDTSSGPLRRPTFSSRRRPLEALPLKLMTLP